MPTLSKGIVAELKVPDQFKLGREFEGGLGSSWLKSCHLNSNEAILISLFYRGTRMTAKDAEGFRRILKTPGTLIDQCTDDTDSDNTDNDNTDNDNTDNDNTYNDNTYNDDTDSDNTDNDDTDSDNTDNDNTDSDNTDNIDAKSYKSTFYPATTGCDTIASNGCVPILSNAIASNGHDTDTNTKRRGGAVRRPLSQIIEQLGACLGNAYNNQIVNHRNGNVGPRFYLKQLQVRQLGDKNVLCVSGHFHDYGGMPESSYMGIFVDATPADNEHCQIHEIIFEAPDEWQFRKHLPMFLNCVESVKWSSASDELTAPRAVASNKALLNLFAGDNVKLAKTAARETDK